MGTPKPKSPKEKQRESPSYLCPDLEYKFTHTYINLITCFVVVFVFCQSVEEALCFLGYGPRLHHDCPRNRNVL